MKIKTCLFTLVITVTLFQSCQKELDNSIPPPPPKPDTLTSGWSKVSLTGETKLSDIFFSSANTGYVVGSKIYKSIDGGQTWTTAFSMPSFFNIFMVDDSRAFFVENQVWNTLNGGLSFAVADGIFDAQDIFFPTTRYGYCTTYNNQFFQTVDSGATWHRVFTTGLSIGGGYSSLFFVSNFAGWIISTSGVYRPIGTLSTWAKATVTGGSGAPFASIYAPGFDTLYVANYQGQVYRSIDGGISFSLLKQFNATGFMDLHFIGTQNGYASIDRFVFKTTDGGVNWNKVVAIGEGVIHEIHFIDANHGWACADGGTVLIFKQ
jgi:photosystem II stability/assembly factor-like uncharacterized protein